MHANPKISSSLVATLVICWLPQVLHAAYVDTVNNYHPVAYWRLGETTGSTAFDVIGTQDGQYHDVTLGQSGAIVGDNNPAAGFSGNSYVEIPHNDAFLLDTGSIQLWFKDTGTSPKAGLFSKDSRNRDTGGHLTVLTSGRRVEVVLQDTKHDHRVKSDKLQLDTWHQVVFTFGNEGMKLYLDDTLADTDAYTGGLATTSGGIGNYEPIALAANMWTSGDNMVTPLHNYFSGLVDEVAIYDYALAPSQVATLYHAQATTIPEPGTVILLALAGMFLFPRFGGRNSA